MKRGSSKFLAVACLSWFSAAPASAQYSPYGRPGGLGSFSSFARPPVVSPYLNLLGATNPGVNYYLLVRPEFERNAFQALTESAIDNFGQRTDAAARSAVEDAIRRLGVADPATGAMPTVRYDDRRPYYNVPPGPTGGGPYVRPRPR
jgi:hypothetical protein